eukprot:6187647-Pleurochrysis_carterae.AAC.3
MQPCAPRPRDAAQPQPRAHSAAISIPSRICGGVGAPKRTLGPTLLVAPPADGETGIFCTYAVQNSGVAVHQRSGGGVVLSCNCTAVRSHEFYKPPTLA